MERGQLVPGEIIVVVPEEILIERVVDRRLDPVTGTTYHLENSPPETEQIVARLTQRSDDSEEEASPSQSYNLYILTLENYYVSFYCFLHHGICVMFSLSLPLSLSLLLVFKCGNVRCRSTLLLCTSKLT